MVTNRVEEPDGSELSTPTLASRLGSSVLLLSLLGVFLVHMWWLPISWQAAGHALTNVVGLEHRWNMFAADPRASSVDLVVYIDTNDGRRQWGIDRSTGEFRYYRWVRWMEAAVHGRPEAEVAGLAEWLSDGEPVEVKIIGYLTPPAEPGKERPPTQSKVIFDSTAGTR